MKIVTVIGARPQFIKAAAVSRRIRELHREILVHTGQHYDANMSEVFFQELEIPLPDYYLNVGSKSHARQTAEMMIGIEEILLKEKPDILLVYGDTNSTLAGALSAGKLNIPIAHVEAGGRAFVNDMPEEQNRKVTDHLSTWNFTSCEEHKRFLAAEGITANVYNVGDVMYDGFIYATEVIKKNRQKYDNIHNRLDYYIPNHNKISDFYLATLHRPENVDIKKNVESIVNGFEKLDLPVIFAVHPRTIDNVKELETREKFNNIHFVKPLGYLDIINLASKARKMITDSGGLQKEAFWLNVPSVVILRNTCWHETLEGNCNILAKPNGEDIIDKLYNTKIDYSKYKINHYGDGTASKQISEILGKQR